MGQKTNLKQQLKKFAGIISVEYPLEKMFLFGSRASGEFKNESDVDLLLVSKSFKNKRKLTRSPPLYLKWDLDYPVDFICLTPVEFNKKKKEIGIVQQAVKEGIQII